jgi:hypothetical protein
MRISGQKDRNNLQALFSNDVTQIVLYFIEGTAIRGRSEADKVGKLNEWDID